MFVSKRRTDPYASLCKPLLPRANFFPYSPRTLEVSILTLEVGVLHTIRLASFLLLLFGCHASNSCYPQNSASSFSTCFPVQCRVSCPLSFVCPYALVLFLFYVPLASCSWKADLPFPSLCRPLAQTLLLDRSLSRPSLTKNRVFSSGAALSPSLAAGATAPRRT